MRFYWIRDRVRQGQFNIYWRKGSHNKADYMTKHHPASHHREIRSAYLHMPEAANRNYFECLTDHEDNAPVTNTDFHNPPAVPTKDTYEGGEGVLISSRRDQTDAASADGNVSQSDARTPTLVYPDHLRPTRRYA